MGRGVPGWDAQQLMSVRGRQYTTDTEIEAKNPRRSSVLVWLFPINDTVCTRLILRTEYEGVHGGQVSFPGGAMEESDVDLWHTAIREAGEEVGLPPGKVEKIGGLSPLYIPPSNFLVQPYIGMSHTAYPPVIDPVEVQCAFDMNVQCLLDPGIKITRMMPRRNTGEMVPVPGYSVNRYFVWGATAMILSELEELLRRINNRRAKD